MKYNATVEVDANTYEFKDFQSNISEEEDCYCENCKTHLALEESDEDLVNHPVEKNNL